MSEYDKALSAIQVNPTSSVSGSGSGVDEDDRNSDKPKISRRSSKASKEDNEFENETKKYLYMAAVQDVKSGVKGESCRNTMMLLSSYRNCSNQSVHPIVTGSLVGRGLTIFQMRALCTTLPEGTSWFSALQLSSQMPGTSSPIEI